MKLHEHQGKELFRRAGIPTPRGEHLQTPESVRDYIEVNPGSWVLKSQVLMGGRGKAGGIKFADDAASGEALARELIGKILRGVQNPDGERVDSLLVEEKVADRERGLRLDHDRSRRASARSSSSTAQGGMDVEEVAAHDPGAIAKYWVDPAIGFGPSWRGGSRSRRTCRRDSTRRSPRSSAACTALFMEYGANLVEINPLVLTKDGRVIASDAKVELDDNGLFRHPTLREWNIEAPSDEDQAAALATGLGRSNYAKLDGAVGVIANGAGLGMGTMDAIRNAGGEAANFLDIGGGAQADLVRKSYALVVERPEGEARSSSTSSAGSRAATKSRTGSSKRSRAATCARSRSSSG